MNLRHPINLERSLLWLIASTSRPILTGIAFAAIFLSEAGVSEFFFLLAGLASVLVSLDAVRYRAYQTGWKAMAYATCCLVAVAILPLLRHG